MVMVDIETLATRPDARILSIGACAVENLLLQEPQEWQTFLVSIPFESREEYFVDRETQKWWAKQGEDAQKALQILAGPDTAFALESFNDWLECIGFQKQNSYTDMTDTIWANPPSFDLTILDHAYRVEEIDKPWHFRQERCIRTVWNDFRDGVRPLTPHRNLVKHRADDDAIRQMCGLVAILRERERMYDFKQVLAEFLDQS